MRRLLNWIQRAWLKHEAANLALAIHEEEQRHREYPRRIAYWLGELAAVSAQIGELERGPVRLASPHLAGMTTRREQPACHRTTARPRSAVVQTLRLPTKVRR